MNSAFQGYCHGEIHFIRDMNCMKGHEAEMVFVQRSPIPFDGQNSHALCVNYFPLTIITLTTTHDRYTTTDYRSKRPEASVQN